MRCQRGSTAFGSYSGSIGQVYEDVGEFFHAVRVFFDELASVGWAALAVALGFHLVKLVFRGVAWRNILRASYPEERIPVRPVFGAYAAGVGVNSIVPGRGGDLVKLYLVRHRFPSMTYATLASTLLAETLLDFVLATAFITSLSFAIFALNLLALVLQRVLA